MREEFDYSEALKRLKKGKKVSCKRWGNEGRVYVQKWTGQLQILVLTDTKREKDVVFTPSVENQFDDVWYEVK